MDQVSEEPTARMDERGLVELDASIPKTSKIDGERAELDARDLTTRKINAELRWLIYEQGVTDVTVLNPSARHSLGTAILARCRAEEPSRRPSATTMADELVSPRSH